MHAPRGELLAETTHGSRVGEIESAHVVPDGIIIREVAKSAAAEVMAEPRRATLSLDEGRAQQDRDGSKRYSLENRGHH